MYKFLKSMLSYASICNDYVAHWILGRDRRRDISDGGIDLEPVLLIWINFNISMDKWSLANKSVGTSYLSVPKLQRLHRWGLGMDK